MVLGPDLPPNPESSEESASRMAEAPDPAEGTPPDTDTGELESVQVRPAQNGGYIAQCSRKEPERKRDGDAQANVYTPPKDYVFTDKAAVMAWLDQELT